MTGQSPEGEAKTLFPLTMVAEATVPPPYEPQSETAVIGYAEVTTHGGIQMNVKEEEEDQAEEAVLEPLPKDKKCH